MKIRDDEYRGFKYTIHFAANGDWGAHLHNFYTECDSNFDGGFSKDIDVVDTAIKEVIDNFYSSLPETEEQLLDALENCLVWTGYEDCHLDRVAATQLIKGFMGSKRELA